MLGGDVKQIMLTSLKNNGNNASFRQSTLLPYLELTGDTNSAPFYKQGFNPDKRDKCLHQIFFLLKNKKKISKALMRLQAQKAGGKNPFLLKK